MKKFLKKNYKFILGIFVGILVSSISVYAAGELFASSIVYVNLQSGLTSTNVQDAVDELSTKADTWIDPSSIDFATFTTNEAKTIYASSKGLCIQRNGKLNCLKVNNWEEEKEHIQSVFSDVSCRVNSVQVDCTASDFTCGVEDSGAVVCYDLLNSSNCDVISNGTVNCFQ